MGSSCGSERPVSTPGRCRTRHQFAESISAAKRERYADDLAALAHVHGSAGAVRLLARRGRATVVVRGDDTPIEITGEGLESVRNKRAPRFPSAELPE